MIFARLDNLSYKDRIKVHFMICFIALVIYRILKRWLDYKYTTKEVFDTLRNTNVNESKDDGIFQTIEDVI